MNTKNIIPRILASPFVLCLIIISFSYEALRRWFCFLMYGGEFIVKDSTDNKSIENIYRILKNKESSTPFTTPEANQKFKEKFNQIIKTDAPKTDERRYRNI